MDFDHSSSLTPCKTIKKGGVHYSLCRSTFHSNQSLCNIPFKELDPQSQLPKSFRPCPSDYPNFRIQNGLGNHPFEESDHQS